MNIKPKLELVITRQSVQDIANVLTCRDKRTLVVVEGRTLCYWSCGAAGQMANECHGKKVQQLEQQL